MHERDIGIGTVVEDVTDDETVSRAEELAVADEEMVRVDGSDITLFRLTGKIKYRHTPLADMTSANMEKHRPPVTCAECGRVIDPHEYAFKCNGLYCLDCGYAKFHHDPDGEYICNRCDSEIDEDGIWSFPDTGTYEDLCLCGRCAMLTKVRPLWEHFLKET